jgi:hypothetical protein
MDITKIITDINGLTPTDQSLVASFVAHMKKVAAINVEKEKPTDAELYWQEIAGLNDVSHELAAPLWEELGALQQAPSVNFRRISQLKLRLRALGEL